MMPKPQLRRRTFIDRPIQGALILRVVMYWVVGTAVQALMIVFLSIVSSSGDDLYSKSTDFWGHVRVALFSSAIILPMLTLDIVRLSHRWVGPIYRLRTALKALARGESIAPISFREGDFWQELATDLNAVALRLTPVPDATNCAEPRGEAETAVS